MSFCPECGCEVKANVKFCSKCGHNLLAATKGTLKKNPPAISDTAHQKPSKPEQDGVSSQVKQPSATKAQIAKAIVKGLAKSLTLSAMVMGPGIALMIFGFQIPGMIWLFLGSFWLMARTYKKPWRLTVLSCLIPPIVTVASYFVQLWLFSGEAFSAPAIGIAIVVGIIFGWWRGRSHNVYWEGNSLFAKRTYGYMVSWVLAYGFTQALAVTASSVLLIRAGLVTGAFTTSVLMMVSIMLLRHRKSSLLPAARQLTVLICGGVILSLFLVGQSTAFAFQQTSAIEAANRELERALDSGVAADIFGAALATGLNEQLRLTQLRRTKDDSGDPDTETYIGFKFSGAEFTARSGSDNLEIVAGMASGQDFRTKAIVSMMAPTLLDEFHNYLIDAGESEFNGNIERTNYGEYGIIFSGPNDENGSTSIGVMVIQGRVFVIGFHSINNPNRIAAMRAMTEASIRYIERMYVAGPGTITISAEEATAATVATLVMLTSAGVAVSLVQSIAAATGQVVQVVTETTVNEVTSALDGQGNMDSAGETNEPEKSAPPSQENDPPPIPKGPTLYDKEGEPFERNEDGEYWAPNEKGDWVWMGEEKARESSAALRGEVLEREAEQRHHDRETERILGESRERIQEENRQAEEEYLQRKAEEGRIAEEFQKRRDRLVEKAEALGKRQGGEVEQEIDQLIEDEGYEGLEDLYRERLEEQVNSGSAESASEQSWEEKLAVGENVAKGVVAAAKGGIMVVGGPAGAAATGLAVGSISAAEEGADSYMRGDPLGKVVAKTAAGFLSGAKDGAISVITNIPGTGAIPKVLIPAAGDTIETYVRTGDGKQAIVSGMVSAGGDVVGKHIDGLGNVVGREVGGAAVTVVSAEAVNVAGGGKFGDAFQEALVKHVGGKAGSSSATSLINRVNSPDTPTAPEPQVDHEQRVREAMGEADALKKKIPIEEMPPSIQELDKGRYREVELDEFGRPKLDENGNEVTTEFVNERGALKQLGNTDESRTAKMGPDPVKEAMINTRQRKIYDPADAETIRRVTPNLDRMGLLKPGDKVAMDSFSTPGEPPSLGADRDARLVILRPNDRPVDSKNDGYDRIEIDREHWETIAHEDFYKHTTKIAESGGQKITPETHPEYFRRRGEMEFMKRPETPAEIEALQQKGYSQEEIARLQQHGLTQEQIDHKAWAEAHNQLFTDRNHMEASADNADQAFDKTGERVQVESNVMPAGRGETTLKDPEGFARMWAEKSRFYDENPPEALAQSQKGIKALMKIRDGYRAQNLTPPPLTERTAKAMEIITKAKVGADASQESIAHVEKQLQDLGYRDLNDSLAKMAYQHELLKWSSKPPVDGGPVPEAGTQVSGLGSSAISRLSRPSSGITEELEKREGP